MCVGGCIGTSLDYLNISKRACAVARRKAIPPPLSLGIDTWGLDFGLLGGDGGILGLPHGYRDSRFPSARESFFSKIPKERVYELTGIQFLPFNTLFQLETMACDGSPLLDVATDLLFMPDLLTYLLTGVKKTEFTFATTSQLYNTIKHDWEDELFEALGLRKSLMQDVVMPGAAIGEIEPEVADEVGIGAIPVIAVATHDTGSAPTRGTWRSTTSRRYGAGCWQ